MADIILEEEDSYLLHCWTGINQTYYENHRKETGFQKKKLQRNRSILLGATMLQTDTHIQTYIDIKRITPLYLRRGLKNT